MKSAGLKQSDSVFIFEYTANGRKRELAIVAPAGEDEVVGVASTMLLSALGQKKCPDLQIHAGSKTTTFAKFCAANRRKK